MTVLSPSIGDLFDIRVIKHHVNNPDNQWANSYEFKTGEAGGAAELLALGEALLQFEKEIHLETVAFDRYIISTWEPDSKPYDPETFVSIPASGLGLKDADGQAPVDLETCWHVTRQAASGRFGHLFYRGVLVEADIEAPAGKSVLTTPATQASDLATAIDDSLLSQYFGISAEGGFYLVMINFTGTQVRPVTQLVSSGVAKVKADHKWFNRTGSPE